MATETPAGREHPELPLPHPDRGRGLSPPPRKQPTAGAGLRGLDKAPGNAAAPRLFRSLSVCSAGARSCFTAEKSGLASAPEGAWPSPGIFKSTWAINRHTNSSRRAAPGGSSAAARGMGQARPIGTCFAHASRLQRGDSAGPGWRQPRCGAQPQPPALPHRASAPGGGEGTSPPSRAFCCAPLGQGERRAAGLGEARSRWRRVKEAFGAPSEGLGVPRGYQLICPR